MPRSNSSEPGGIYSRWRVFFTRPPVGEARLTLSDPAAPAGEGAGGCRLPSLAGGDRTGGVDQKVLLAATLGVPGASGARSGKRRVPHPHGYHVVRDDGRFPASGGGGGDPRVSSVAIQSNRNGDRPAGS